MGDSMTLMRNLIVAAMAMLALAGCGRIFKATCVQPADYAGEVDRPPLKVPAGLDAPDTRRALPIPPLSEPERPRSAADPCLDAPPRFAIPRQQAPAA
jgi:uncharacterized lipoprotein